MRQIPSCEPRAFVAGDTVQWTTSLGDFSSLDGYALSYRLTNAATGGEIKPAAIAAVANGSGGWDVTIAAADSDVDGGTWRLIGWVTKDAERTVIYNDIVRVSPNAATAEASSLQTANEKILAAIDARLSGRITADQETIQINGTSLARIPIERLAVLRGVYAAKVWREQHPGRSNPRHLTRFV